MDKLLAYTPEPFAELNEWGQEEEIGRRRSARGAFRTTKAMPFRSATKPGSQRFRGTSPWRTRPLRPVTPLRPPVGRITIPFIPPVLGVLPVNPGISATESKPAPENKWWGDAGGSSSPQQTPDPMQPDTLPSEHIRWVQDCLNQTLGLQLVVDGVMNRETRSAVRLFQERKGLQVSGLVGPDTEEALKSSCRLEGQESRQPQTEFFEEIPFTGFQPEMDEFEYVDFEFPESEEDLFLGKIVRKASSAVSSAGRSVGKTAGRAAKSAYKAAGKGAKLAVRYSTPPGLKTLTKFGLDVAKGKNVLKAARAAAKAGISDLREQMRYAQMVSSFVPGIGTGMAAALGAANALAAGRPITDALIEAARGAIPGGPLAQAAFDMGVNLAKGKNLSQAALSTARNRLPPAGRAAFDTAVALGKGQNLQQAAFRGVGQLLPGSPYATNTMAFVRNAGLGRNIQTAALSPAGRHIWRRVQRELGEMEYEMPQEMGMPSAAELAMIEHEFIAFRQRLAE